MPRYVDADKVIDVMKAAYWDENMQSAKDDPCVIDAMIDWSIRQVKEAPTEDVAPVIHAHWIFIGNENPLYTHKCSNCGEGKFFHSTIEMRLSNEFCSCCGAWMYGE